MNTDAVTNSLSKWILDLGPYHDVVISSRIRLARNIADYVFPARLSGKGRMELVDKIEAAVRGIRLPEGELRLVRLEELPDLQRQMLVEKHLISPQHARAERGSALLLTDDESVAVMVNEEDHLRIQVLLSGLQLHEAWNMATRVDDALEEKIKYAFDEKYGYLTCCPTNVGTGLRASVMVHLPGLVMTGQINKVLNALSQVGAAVRGMYGEGTEAAGNLFQISNQITIGSTEAEVINNLSTVVRRMIEQERSARDLLLQGDARLKLMDRFFRAYAIVSHARLISSQEALELLSDVKMGMDVEAIKGIDGRVFNELMVMIQPAFLQHIAGEEMDEDARDAARAELIRKRIQGEE